MAILPTGFYIYYIILNFVLVCIKFLQKFEKTLTDADRKDDKILTEKLKKACDKAKNKENRFVSLFFNLNSRETHKNKLKIIHTKL